MSIRQRIERLEADAGGDGCGPGCPPQVFRCFVQEGEEGEPVFTIQEPADPCPRCGRPAQIANLIEIIDTARQDESAAESQEA